MTWFTDDAAADSEKKIFFHSFDLQNFILFFSQSALPAVNVIELDIVFRLIK